MAASAAHREGSSPGPAPRLISPRSAGAPPRRGAAVERAATQARGLCAAPAAPQRAQGAARPRAPADRDLARAPVRSRPGAGAAVAPRVGRPPQAPPAPVPVAWRVGEWAASSRVQRAQAPGPRPAFAPPLAPPRPTRGPLANRHAPTPRAQRVPVGSAALSAVGRALRATSGSHAASAAEPQAPLAWQGAGGRRRDVRVGAAPVRPRRLPRGLPLAGSSWEMAARAREPWWAGLRHRPRAPPASGLPRCARAPARGEPPAAGEVCAGRQARSARAFSGAPEPAAVAAGSAPRWTGSAAATAAGCPPSWRQTAVAAPVRCGAPAASARRGAAAERPRRTPWRPPSPPPQAALGRCRCRHGRGRAAPACLRLPHLSRFSPFSGQSPFAACAGGQKEGMQQYVPDRQCSIRKIWGKHGIQPTT